MKIYTYRLMHNSAVTKFLQMIFCYVREILKVSLMWTQFFLSYSVSQLQSVISKYSTGVYEKDKSAFKYFLLDIESHLGGGVMDLYGTSFNREKLLTSQRNLRGVGVGFEGNSLLLKSRETSSTEP